MIRIFLFCFRLFVLDFRDRVFLCTFGACPGMHSVTFLVRLYLVVLNDCTVILKHEADVSVRFISE